MDKVHHITRHTGTETEYRYSSTLSLTSALDGVGGQGRRLNPGKDPAPIVQEAAWPPGPVWTGAGNHNLNRTVFIPTELLRPQ
jgi:hypothetical protein